MAPEIAVVVASHDRPLRLRWLLEARSEQTLPPDRFEVVMGIPDRRALVDRRWRVRITQEAIAGARAVVEVGRILDEPEPDRRRPRPARGPRAGRGQGHGARLPQTRRALSRERCVDAYRSLYQEIAAGA